MAVSKKPRHKRKTKTWLSPFKLSAEGIQGVRDVFRLFELAIEIKLPNGDCDDDDISCIMDLFNLCTVGMASREWLDEKEVADIRPIYAKALFALAAVAERKKEIGRYVCKGDELTLIRDMAVVAGTFIQDSLNICPRRLLKEWLAMRDLTDNKPKCIPRGVTNTDIKRAVARY